LEEQKEGVREKARMVRELHRTVDKKLGFFNLKNEIKQ